MNVSNCGKCDAPMIWVRTRTGKHMPLDADPTELGTFHIVEGPDAKLEGHHINRSPLGLADAGDRYTSHFATCPEAEHFRRPR